jgi:hypothetical protein
VVSFGFNWWDVADGGEEPPVVVPVDPFQGSYLDSVQAAPWPFAADQLGLE